MSRSDEAPAGQQPARVPRRRKPRPEPWYAPGLRFECTACGKCCTNHGEFSAVYANREEREALARHFGLTREEFESSQRAISSLTSAVVRDGVLLHDSGNPS